MSCSIIPFPQELTLRLPTIIGNVDYLTLERQLGQIDSLLRESGVELRFVELSLEQWGKDRSPSATEQIRYQQRSRRALRCTVLRTLLQADYREFSCQLAGSPLYQWFCGVGAVDAVRVPSKSELQRYAHWLPEAAMREILDGLLLKAVEAPRKLKLPEALDLEAVFMDSTCLKANIHFPTDWVLLRDGVRTLMKAVILIRDEGIKGRMESPEAFMNRMNQLSMEMAMEGRRSGSKKGRKRVLRKMKKVVKAVRQHAQRHRALLEERWEETSWTRKQTEVILGRMDGVLKLLPQAQKQAHERIIGGRPVANADKILSLYERDVRVIVRGKAGAEVEFGNTAVIAENSQGVIVDYRLIQEQAPADSRLLMESLERTQKALGRKVGAAVTDRGFASASNSAGLEKAGTFDALCPRVPGEMSRRMKEAKFRKLQRRRAQTEGRIGVLKANFLGQPMKAKSFEHRELALAWGVLTHNLWVLARMRKIKKARRPKTQVQQAA